MFFILSKTVAVLLLPSNVLIALGLGGVVLLATRRMRAGVALIAASIVLLALAGFSPLGDVLTAQLENRFPPWDPARGVPDGIVVLGGGIDTALSNEYDEPILTRDGGRLTALATLARAYPKARIVYSNGDASLSANGRTDEKYLTALLDSFGIPRERVTMETKARNTFENAVFSKELAQPKPGERWLLVTSAYHMPRAVGCFRRVGFDAEAFPVAWRAYPHGVTFSGALGGGLYALDFAAHEWLGVIAYRLSGRVTALLPAP